MTDEDVIQLNIRFHLSTISLLHAGPGKELKERSGIENRVHRMVRDKVLSAFTLHHREQYHLLTAKTCREYGIDEKRAKPMGLQALVTNYGIALYCVEHGRNRSTKAWMQEKEPELLAYGLSADKYTKTPENELALLIPDVNASPRHLIRKCRRQWDKRRKLPAWRALMDSHQFVLIPIVARRSKADRLSRGLRNTGVMVRPFVAPKLADLFGGERE